VAAVVPVVILTVSLVALNDVSCDEEMLVLPIFRVRPDWKFEPLTVSVWGEVEPVMGFGETLVMLGETVFGLTVRDAVLEVPPPPELVTVTLKLPAVFSVTVTVSWLALTKCTEDPLKVLDPTLTDAPDLNPLPLTVRVCDEVEAVMGLGERLEMEGPLAGRFTVRVTEFDTPAPGLVTVTPTAVADASVTETRS
jgi:hypothetical protein